MIELSYTHPLPEVGDISLQSTQYNWNAEMHLYYVQGGFMTVKEVSDLVLQIRNDQSLPEKCRELLSRYTDCNWEILNLYDIDIVRVVPEEEYLDELLEDLETAGYKLVSFSNDSENNNKIYTKSGSSYPSLQELKASGEYFVNLEDIFLNDYNEYVNKWGFRYPDNFVMKDAEPVEEEIDRYILERYFPGRDYVCFFSIPYLEPRIVQHFVDVSDNIKERGMYYASDLPVFGVNGEDKDSDDAFDDEDYDSDEFYSKVSLHDFIPTREEFGSGFVQEPITVLPEEFRKALISNADFYVSSKKPVVDDSDIHFAYHYFIHSSEGKLCKDDLLDGSRTTEVLYNDELKESELLALKYPDMEEDVKLDRIRLCDWQGIEKFLKESESEVYLLGIGDLSDLRVIKMPCNCLTILGKI